MRCVTGDVRPEHQHSFGLDANLELGGLAADDEVATEAFGDHHLCAVRPRLGAFLVGNDDQLDAHTARRLRLGQVGEGEHHRAEGPLHVVGAPAEKLVAGPAGNELLGVSRHDVQVTVQQDLGRARADPGDQTLAPFER